MTEVRIEISDASLGLPVAEKHEADDTAVLIERFGQDFHALQDGEATLVFDMNSVQRNVSHSVVAMMIALIGRANSAVGKVQARIAGATPEVVEKLKIMHLDGMFQIEPRASQNVAISAEF